MQVSTCDKQYPNNKTNWKFPSTVFVLLKQVLV